MVALTRRWSGIGNGGTTNLLVANIIMLQQILVSLATELRQGLGKPPQRKEVITRKYLGD